MNGPTPRLRDDLTIEPTSDGAFHLVDSLTRRRFAVDEAQVEVLRALDGTSTPNQIASDVLGDPAVEPELTAFVEKLRAFGMLHGEADAAGRQATAVADAGRARHDAKVRDTVRFAASSIPFYRERFRGLADAVEGPADLSRLPTMTKRDVRENFPSRMLPDGISAAELVASGEVELYSTSGTTGERLQTFYDAKRHAYPERFPGIDPVPGRWGAARIALFTTPICSGAVCHMGGSSYEDRLMKDGTYLALHSSDRVLALTRSELEGILRDVERFQPTILRTDPVYAFALARALEREGLPFPKFDVIWTAYEYCSVIHRPLIERAFGAPVHTLYAATDLGGGCQAFRCTNGHYHVRHNQYIFEFLGKDEQRVAPGRVGEIAVTSLYHRFVPVIRYRVEDLGRPLETPCSCADGAWPAFDLEGRIKDCMRATDGRLVTTRAFDDLFLGLDWLDFYQATQVGERSFDVLGMRRAGTDTRDAEVFLDRARGLLGQDAELRLKYVRQIAAEQSYKFRLTGSRVSEATSVW